MIRWLTTLAASYAARRLSRHGHQTQRELVKAKARQMRADLGLPPLRALR